VLHKVDESADWGHENSGAAIFTRKLVDINSVLTNIRHDLDSSVMDVNITHLEVGSIDGSSVMFRSVGIKIHKANWSHENGGASSVTGKFVDINSVFADIRHDLDSSIMDVNIAHLEVGSINGGAIMNRRVGIKVHKSVNSCVNGFNDFSSEAIQVLKSDPSVNWFNDLSSEAIQVLKVEVTDRNIETIQVHKLEGLISTVIHASEIINLSLDVVASVVVHSPDVAVVVLLVDKISALSVFGVDVELVLGFQG